MSENTSAIETLLRSRKELIHDIAESGISGGVGRSQQYAAVLVTIQNAINIIQELEAQSNINQADRMAAVRAAKQNK